MLTHMGNNPTSGEMEVVHDAWGKAPVDPEASIALANASIGASRPAYHALPIEREQLCSV